MSTIIVHGPQGCGKTRNAAAIAAHFGCTQIVDEWDGCAPLPAGTLALTNIEHFWIPAHARLYSFDEVAALLQRGET